MTSPDPTAVDRFRALLWSDMALQDRLSLFDRPDQFVASAIEIAAAHDIPIATSDLSGAAKPDPLGIASLDGASANARGIPPRQWLPTSVVPSVQGPAVNWAHFGGAPLAESFFADSLRRAGARPLNRLLSLRTPLQDLIDSPPVEDALAPDGFIFHMSRCGSTLVSQMLAAIPGTIAVSEPSPVDVVVRMTAMAPQPPEWQVRALQAMVAALGRNRSGDARHYFVKTDAWHILALPLFRAAFPSVPWIFLYRDPIEVIVSQMQMSGMMAVPSLLSPEMFGIDMADAFPSPDYCSRVMAALCAAAVERFGAGGGILVNYSELPDAVSGRILGHFGIKASAGDLAAMTIAARRDAKHRYQNFRGDAETKQRAASPAVREAVRKHLSGVYAKLEALRIGQ
jgi:hypothetical protein